MVLKPNGSSPNKSNKSQNTPVSNTPPDVIPTHIHPHQQDEDEDDDEESEEDCEEVQSGGQLTLPEWLIKQGGQLDSLETYLESLESPDYITLLSSLGGIHALLDAVDIEDVNEDDEDAELDQDIEMDDDDYDDDNDDNKKNLQKKQNENKKMTSNNNSEKSFEITYKLLTTHQTALESIVSYISSPDIIISHIALRILVAVVVDWNEADKGNKMVKKLIDFSIIPKLFSLIYHQNPMIVDDSMYILSKFAQCCYDVFIIEPTWKMLLLFFTSEWLQRSFNDDIYTSNTIDPIHRDTIIATYLKTIRDVVEGYFNNNKGPIVEWINPLKQIVPQVIEIPSKFPLSGLDMEVFEVLHGICFNKTCAEELLNFIISPSSAPKSVVGRSTGPNNQNNNKNVVGFFLPFLFNVIDSLNGTSYLAADLLCQLIEASFRLKNTEFVKIIEKNQGIDVLMRVVLTVPGQCQPQNRNQKDENDENCQNKEKKIDLHDEDEDYDGDEDEDFPFDFEPSVCVFALGALKLLVRSFRFARNIIIKKSFLLEFAKIVVNFTPDNDPSWLQISEVADFLGHFVTKREDDVVQALIDAKWTGVLCKLMHFYTELAQEQTDETMESLTELLSVMWKHANEQLVDNITDSNVVRDQFFEMERKLMQEENDQDDEEEDDDKKHTMKDDKKHIMKDDKKHTMKDDNQSSQTQLELRDNQSSQTQLELRDTIIGVLLDHESQYVQDFVNEIIQLDSNE